MDAHRSAVVNGPNWGRLLAATALLAWAGGACHMLPSIRITDKVDGAQPRGRVAVVCGQRTRHCALLAERITARLSADGTISVLSQEEIAGRLEVYPGNLSADSFLTEKAAADVTMTEAHKVMCARLQEKLGVDYVLLVWFRDYSLYRTEHSRYDGKNFSTYSTFRYYIEMRGRLAGFPGSEVTGAVDYSIDTDCGISFFSASHNEFLTQVIDRAAGSIVKRILKAWR